MLMWILAMAFAVVVMGLGLTIVVTAQRPLHTVAGGLFMAAGFVVFIATLLG